MNIIPRWPSPCPSSGLPEDYPMMRIDGAYLYTLGARLHPLADISSSASIPASEALYPLFLADTSLNQLLQNRWFGLHTCMKQGELFLEAIRDMTKKITDMKDHSVPLAAADVWKIKQHAQNFEVVLTAELGITDLYYVIPKGSHRTIELIAGALVAFPDDLSTKVPLAVGDIQEATRCLAFARFTACGFHLHRANEAVLRKYWDAVTNGAKPPKQESMGAFLGELKRRKKGTAKVRATLGEIKDLHRNPIIHPEHTLDQKQALALMGVINASVTYMLEAIPAPAQAAPPTLSASGIVSS